MSADVLSPEERVGRIKAALMEAGYDDPIRLDPDRPLDDYLPILIHKDVPDEVIWRAFAVVGEAGSCWPCWSSDDFRGYDCPHDPLTSPWPEVLR